MKLISDETYAHIAHLTWNELAYEYEKLEVENVALRNAGRHLMSVLPDSVAHENPDCWEWCWNELDGNAQDEVKSARNDWNNALLTEKETP